MTKKTSKPFGRSEFFIRIVGGYCFTEGVSYGNGKAPYKVYKKDPLKPREWFFKDLFDHGLPPYNGRNNCSKHQIYKSKREHYLPGGLCDLVYPIPWQGPMEPKNEKKEQGNL